MGATAPPPSRAFLHAVEYFCMLSTLCLLVYAKHLAQPLTISLLDP